MGRRFLVTGYEGRDHALAWMLARSPQVETVYVMDGNHAMPFDNKLSLLPKMTHEELAQFAVDNRIDCTVAGDTSYSHARIVDVFAERGLAILCATPNAAVLEESKLFGKRFMSRHRIPTARYRLCEDPHALRLLARSCSYPLMMKSNLRVSSHVSAIAVADAAGAATAFDQIYEKQKQTYTENKPRVLLEEFIRGRELSYMILTDGTDWVPLMPVRDYKRLQDGDTGPNTGGMGSMAPVPWMTPEMERKIRSKIVEPTVRGMRAEGLNYRGFLYIGIMVDAQGDPWVLEYNTRLGDTEAQTMLMLLESDFAELALQAATGSLANVVPAWRAGWAVSVAFASKSYPLKITAAPVSLPFPTAEDVKCFGSIINRGNDGRFVTGDGRAGCVTAYAPTLDECRRNAYEMLRRLDPDGLLHYRSDVALMPAAAAPAAREEADCAIGSLAK